MDTHVCIAPFLESMTVMGASPNTIRAYRADLLGWIESSPTDFPTGSTLTPTETLTLLDRPRLEFSAAQYLTNLRQQMSPRTINRKMASIRQWAKFMGMPDFLSNYKAPKPPKGIAHPIPEGVQGLSRMLGACKTTQQSALIGLTGFMGLRIGEALTMRVGDFSMEERLATVRGKGDKQRHVPMSDVALSAILPRWIEASRGLDDRLLPMHDRTARRAITSIAKRAGINPVASHDMRMTFGTVAYHNSGGDLRAVQELLGHSSSHTTENYTLVEMNKMRQAASFGEG